MSGHTPGPWETKWPKINCTIESRGGVVATVYIGHTIADTESVANAQLIAAAPDLLAAIKAILLMRDAMSQNAHVDDRLCEIAEAAIAKAEGR